MSFGQNQGPMSKPSGLTKFQHKLLEMETAALNQGFSRTQLTTERLSAALTVLLTKQVCSMFVLCRKCRNVSDDFIVSFCSDVFQSLPGFYNIKCKGGTLKKSTQSDFSNSWWLSLLILTRRSPARSWKCPLLQIKLLDLNVVKSSADSAVCVPVCSTWTEAISTAGGLNACLAVPASNARSLSRRPQGRAKNILFTVRSSSSYFSIICVLLTIFSLILTAVFQSLSLLSLVTSVNEILFALPSDD